MLEIRLRILDVRERETDPFSYLGVADGFPEVLVHATSIVETERDLVNALEGHLERLKDYKTTLLERDDFPTVWTVRLQLAPSLG